MTVKYGGLYLAGPMTSIGPPTWNFPAFREAASALRKAGYAVWDPSETGLIQGFEWSDYLRLGLTSIVKHCDGVATLPGWETSDGAQLEVFVANALGLQVESVDWWLGEREQA